jgi:uncharacterized protein YcfL
MKKIFIFIASLMLVSCASSESVTKVSNVRQSICKQDPNCTNTSIHDHVVFFTW